MLYFRMSYVKMNSGIYLIPITNPAINNLHALSIFSLLLILKYNILEQAREIFLATLYSLPHIL